MNVTEEEFVVRDQDGRVRYARRVTQQQPPLLPPARPNALVSAVESTIATVVRAVIGAVVILTCLFIIAQLV